MVQHLDGIWVLPFGEHGAPHHPSFTHMCMLYSDHLLVLRVFSVFKVTLEPVCQEVEPLAFYCIQKSAKGIPWEGTGENVSSTGDTKEKDVVSEHEAKLSLEMGSRKSETMNQPSSSREQTV